MSRITGLFCTAIVVSASLCQVSCASSVVKAGVDRQESVSAQVWISVLASRFVKHKGQWSSELSEYVADESTWQAYVEDNRREMTDFSNCAVSPQCIKFLDSGSGLVILSCADQEAGVIRRGNTWQIAYLPTKQ